MTCVGVINAYTKHEGKVRWLDLVALKHEIFVRRWTALSVVKGEELSQREYVGVVVAYQDKKTGEERTTYPKTPEEWEDIEPVIEFLEGWPQVFGEGKIHPAYLAFLKKIEQECKIPVE